MKSVLLVALASMCTPVKPSPSPAPAPTVIVFDAGPLSPLDSCEAAQQRMVQLSCPPEEDAFGGWVAECSGWSHASVITSCIQRQSTCLGTRQCLGESS